MEYVVLEEPITNELQRLRLEKRLSQREVERRAQLPTGSLSKIENNKYERMHVTNFIRLGQAVDFFEESQDVIVTAEPYNPHSGGDIVITSADNFINVLQGEAQKSMLLPESEDDRLPWLRRETLRKAMVSAAESVACPHCGSETLVTVPSGQHLVRIDTHLEAERQDTITQAATCRQCKERFVALTTYNTIHE